MSVARSPLFHAFRVAVFYLLFAGSWILFSDRLLDYFVKDHELNLFLQTAKGWSFVLVTGALLFAERKWSGDLFLSSEARFRLFLERSIEGVVLAGQDGTIAVWNSSMGKITGISGNNAAGRNLCDIAVHDDSLNAVLLFPSAVVIRAAQYSEADLSSVNLHFLLDGRPREVETALFKVPAGKVFFLGGIVRDVTERNVLERSIRKSLKEKEVLLKEVHHRVKNNLQLVISLLRIQGADIHDEKALSMFQGSIGRIRSIAMIHENLYHQEDLSMIDMGAYIRKMGNDLSDMYKRPDLNVSLNYDIDDSLVCRVDRAVPFGLLLNELLTNALKYAGDAGNLTISVTFRRQNGVFHFQLRDNGAGIPENADPSGGKSIGMNLICNLPAQIGGSYRLYNDNGAVFELEFSDDDSSE